MVISWICHQALEIKMKSVALFPASFSPSFPFLPLSVPPVFLLLFLPVLLNGIFSVIQVPLLHFMKLYFFPSST